MITEEYLRKSHVFRRLKSGPQGQFWLGHDSIDTTQIYLHAHLARKEAALAKLKPYERRKRVRFKPSDRLLAFLEAL